MDLSERDLTKLREASATLAAVKRRRDLPSRTLEAVGRIIDADVLTYNEVTSEPDGIAYLVAPARTVLDDEAFLAHFGEHPLISHARSSAKPEAIQIADFLDRRSFHRLGLYQEFFRPAGIEHQLALSIPAGGGTVIGIALNRESDRFSERERTLLDLLSAPILSARRYVAVRDLAATALRATELQGGTGGIGVVLLDGGGAPQFSNCRARKLLAQCFGGSDRDQLPAELAAWVAERGGVESGAHRARRTSHPMGAGRRLLCELSPAGEFGVPRIMLLRSYVDEVTAVLRDGYELTRRQREVVGLLATGLSDKQIAAELGLSPRTVQKHLEGAYRRLGVVSRTGALALISGLGNN
jgi:DNA-binding CsgD family transcriptional regulator